MKRLSPHGWLALVVLLLTGCSKSQPPAERPQAIESTKPELVTVTPERSDLLFRYREGEAYRTSTQISDIPKALRGKVHVIDLSKTPSERGDAKWVQVFDLTVPGQFTGKLVSRDKLESAMKQADEAKPKAPRTIMYSTEWCGVCKKARRFMTKNGVAFVEKDIEKDKGAGRELRKKAAAAGVNAGGVPVFDIGGKIISGFDPNTVLRLTGKTPRTKSR